MHAGAIIRSGALHAAPCRCAAGSPLDESCVTGQITVAKLESGLSIEVMDYTFSQLTVVDCGVTAPFIELLDLASVKAVRTLGPHSCPVEPGIHVTLCTDTDGQLAFCAGVPVQGLRIRLSLDVYDTWILRRFPRDSPSHAALRALRNRTFYHARMRTIFNQVKDGVCTGLDSELYYESKLMELVSLLGRHYSNSSIGTAGAEVDTRGGTSTADDEAVERVVQRLSEALEDPPSVTELASLAHASPSKLQRDFKRTTGCTIHEYLRRLRMERARELVCGGNEPLHRVAHKVGYRKPGSFSKVYREAHGISPSQHRRLLRTGSHA
jgi:AraC-like DNA-binding protein